MIVGNPVRQKAGGGRAVNTAATREARGAAPRAKDTVNAIADPRDTQGAVERAIARVLDAEHEARDDVRQAGIDAAALTEAARAQARALAERVEGRLRKVRASFEGRAAAEVARLDAAALVAAQRHDLSVADLDHASAAAAALAARLTGTD